MYILLLYYSTIIVSATFPPPPPHDSTLIALDRQCLGLRRRSPGPARGCVDWCLGQPTGPGGSGVRLGPKLIIIDPEGSVCVCDPMLFCYRVERGYPIEDLLTKL